MTASNPATITPTGQVAEFVESMRLEEVPESTLQRTRLLLLDWLGVAIAGSREAAPNTALAAVRPLSAGGPATVIGHSERLDPVNAALVNGMAGHVLDFDNSSEPVYGFVSSPTVPVCLALGEMLGATGAQLLEAYLVGLEVCGKMGECMPPDHYDAGWHSTPTIGILGATAAAANLLKLPATRVAWALGVASSMASGLRQNYGTMTKSFHPGNAARDGVLAGLLAREGLTADENILDARYGFGPVFAAGGKCSYDAFERLGNPYSVDQPGIKTRRFPCCAGNHRPLDALFLLMEEHRFSAEEVERVDVGVLYRTMTTLMHPRPRNGLEAKFSLPYCLSRAILDRALHVDHFADDRVADPKVQAFMPRIHMFPHPELQESEGLKIQFAEVNIVLRDGRKLVKRAYEPRGHPRNPMSEAELRDKFLATASLVLSREQCDGLMRAVDSLPNSTPVAELAAYLRP